MLFRDRGDGVVEFEAFPRDTSLEASRVQYAAWKRMGEGRRSQAAMEMSDAVREIAAAGVRERHPEYSDDQVRLAVILLCLGEDLFRHAYPGVEVRP